MRWILLWAACFSSVILPSLSCYVCFVAIEDTLTLCEGFTVNGFRNMDACSRMVDRIFTENQDLIEAGRVGEGFDETLKNLLYAEIQPIINEFDQQLNLDTVYESRLQTAADNFIAAASQLPRVTGCLPPCGYQPDFPVYNCIICRYDSCGFDLDCPVVEVEVMENSGHEMWCEVPFNLPVDVLAVWSFAEEINTQDREQFKEVFAGADALDRLYSIPSVTLHHQGTYQCEIFSSNHSIVRLYFFITDVDCIKCMRVLYDGVNIPQSSSRASLLH